MHIRDKIIVLNTIPYSDSKIIINAYSEKKGRIAFMHFKSKSRRKKGGTYFHPLALIDADYKDSEKKSIHIITSSSHRKVLQSLLSNPVKRNIALFISEMLNAVMHEEEPDQNVFNFLETQIEWLNANHRHLHLFHPKFLLELAQFSGFFPNLVFIDAHTRYLNLITGEFDKTYTPTCASETETLHIKILSETPWDDMDSIPISTKEVGPLLDKILLFYQFHYPDFKPPESLAVFREF